MREVIIILLINMILFIPLMNSVMKAGKRHILSNLLNPSPRFNDGPNYDKSFITISFIKTRNTIYN